MATLTAPHRRDSAIRTLSVARCVPRKLKVPGGLVALVAPDGEVMLLFRIAKIEEGASVTKADGKQTDRGCVLVAKKGTMRIPGLRDPKVLNVNRYAVGGFAYFDAETNQRVIYELDARPGGRDASTPKKTFPPRRYALFANNIGQKISQPERQLIRAYTKWVGDVGMFAHHPLKETGRFTDLFIACCWTGLSVRLLLWS